MRSKNICKFVTPDTDSHLMPLRFILETEPEAMNVPDPRPVFRMVLVTRQEGRFKLGSHHHRCAAGDVILFFENETYFFEGEPGFQYMYIDFRGSRAAELFRRFGITENNRLFSGFDGLIPLWMESLSRASGANIDLAAESMLLYTLSKFTAENSRANDRIDQIIEMTEEGFSDPQLSISTIAEQLGYSSKYLSHIFKKKMGMGYTEYLQTYRIKYAVSLFGHGLDSIKNVALLSGFSDPLYFSTVFKNKIGVSPKTYIKDLYGQTEDSE